MEEQKRKRKRRKVKNKKSKSIFVETVGYKSKNTISNNNNAYLADVKLPAIDKKAKLTNDKQVDQLSKTQHVKDLKRKRNRIRKRKKGVTTKKSINSPDVNEINSSACSGNVLVDDHRLHSSDINQYKTVPDVKLKKGSKTFMALPSKSGNTSNHKLSLKEKLQNKLESGRFRWINEKLYTSSSSSAYEMFKSEPELFDVYHQGFSSQVEKWPVNPVDSMIEWIMERSPQLVIADMGCGEAKISQNVPNKVFSFDLVAFNDLVTACDVAKVPLSNDSVDIVIYCLSLMGTNLNDFLQEAHRILKADGILKIAEVVSRFECLTSFEKTVCRFGFKLLAKDTTNKMFVQFEFKKIHKKPDQMKNLALSLKPCLYKRR